MSNRRRIKIVDDEKNITRYFNEIASSKPLSRKEELILWTRYKMNGDIGARNKLMEANLKFVVSVANCYRGKGLSFDELIAEGNLGLVKAMEMFEGHRGNKFISYSIWWIRETITDAIEKRGCLDADEMPVDYKKQGFDDEQVDIVNPNCPFAPEEEDTEEDRTVRMRIIEDLMSELTDREREIVTRYYGVDGERKETLESIGTSIDITKERTRQIVEKSLMKMRNRYMEKNVSQTI